MIRSIVTKYLDSNKNSVEVHLKDSKENSDDPENDGMRLKYCLIKVSGDLNEKEFESKVNKETVMTSKGMIMMQKELAEKNIDAKENQLIERKLKISWVPPKPLTSKHDQEIQRLIAIIDNCLKFEHAGLSREILDIKVPNPKQINEDNIAFIILKTETVAQEDYIIERFNNAKVQEKQLQVVREFFFSYKVEEPEYSLFSDELKAKMEMIKAKHPSDKTFHFQQEERPSRKLHKKLWSCRLTGENAQPIVEGAALIAETFKVMYLQINLQPISAYLFDEISKTEFQKAANSNKLQHTEQSKEHDDVKDIGQKLGVIFKRNFHSRKLGFVGSQELASLVEKEIESYLANYQTKKISYENASLRPLLKNQNQLLKSIQTRFKITKTRINFAEKVIEITGLEDNLAQATPMLVNSLRSSPNRKRTYGAKDCPICFQQVTNAYTLLNCDHTFCQGCLGVHLSQSINDQSSIPVKCAGCASPIALIDLLNLLSDSDFDKMVNFSLKAFLLRNRTEYMNCPTLDCRQIFKLNQSQPVTCTLCKRSYCTWCQKMNHHPKTCEEAGKESLDEIQKLHQQWATEVGIRPCGNCRVPIEKNGGCLRVECAACKRHNCWVCEVKEKTVFVKKDDCYRHLGDVHGKIFDAHERKANREKPQIQ